MDLREWKLEHFSGVAMAAVVCVMAVALATSSGQDRPDAKATTEAKTGEDTMVFKKIGVIHSPYTPKKGAPRQGGLAPDAASTIELDAEYEAGLQDIETFSHIIVLYAFDRSKGWSRLVKTPWGEKRRGVFATRSPRRPNPIGMTVVKLVKREGTTLHVTGLDAFDGTPLLDLKPYVPKFDSIQEAGGGWLGEENKDK